MKKSLYIFAFLAFSTTNANAEWNPSDWKSNRSGTDLSIVNNKIQFEYPADEGTSNVEIINANNVVLNPGQATLVMKVEFPIAGTNFTKNGDATNDNTFQIFRQIRLGDNNSAPQQAPWFDTGKVTTPYYIDPDNENIVYFWRNNAGKITNGVGDNATEAPSEAFTIFAKNTNQKFTDNDIQYYGRSWIAIRIARKNQQAFDGGTVNIGYLDIIDPTDNINMSGSDATVGPRIKNYIETELNKTQTGIGDINVDENAPVEYYNLQGIRVENPENGLYIRRQGNTVTKILVK